MHIKKYATNSRRLVVQFQRDSMRAMKEFKLLIGKDEFIKVIETLRQNIRHLRQNIICSPFR